MERRVVHAAFEDISDSDAMSERLFEEMKEQRDPNRNRYFHDTSQAEQSIDAALKIGQALVVYQPEETTTVAIPSLEDDSH